MISGTATIRSLLYRAAMYAFAYEVGLRDVLRKTKRVDTDLYVFESERKRKRDSSLPILILLYNENLGSTIDKCENKVLSKR